ncbi:AAA family ATPase [Phormidium sp. LEGE 05292]|uniref:trifunctional serine/threonine-protein kinase/ATP-binding protein/sensor histidine kinase n=1 Tax=[Phormidium] sp. LEGE 05292 TaxID=767427 RepID=UPI001882A3B5|nr:ATP-binding sensor histidine kinase [Phormidium sp. LEGE 05292]MBE9224226.1 AAA family ATPase [Phormidium sp. LEGE 05292]
MTVKLPGYQLLETVHSGGKTVIYRGQRETDKTSVIVKTLRSEYPTLEEITRLRHEYKIMQPLHLAGVIQPYELKDYQHSLALVLEDFPGITLKDFISSQTNTLIDFLKIAIDLAQTLGELHENHIIHKDIKPHNILIDPESCEIKLIDFSISSLLDKENPTISNLNLLEGTLAYMSPEQTGRMNRSIDYRTDFYSLGVTFYEMLTGTLPFNSTDPMELVHCHIAKIPAPPCQGSVCCLSEVPEAVAAIVMKLLAKNAEDRYQSAWGLKSDLEECLNQFQSTGKIENFVPGRLDKSGQFLIPQKLYGRENEVATLMDAFARVAASASEIMLVSGYSGIGKTSVVNEVHKPIVGARGYFIAGKFDQFKRNIPYAAIAQAFGELLRQMFAENAQEIIIWKEKLETALGENGRVIIDVIPEVEFIIGKQPEVPQLGPTESQNRFNRVFKQFLSTFATQEHPLVVFLDDLQWADAASLKLIQLLTTDPDSQYLLVIGAYRDNEVSPTHPLILTLEEVEKAGAKVSNIVLCPLNFANVTLLIADTLKEIPDLDNSITPKNRVFGLAELLFNKTGGNPFFLTQLFKTLYAEKLITFDFHEGRWLWDIEKIQAIGITDYNVVELVARNIQKLSVPTQKALKLAACIGNTFSLENLAIVNEQSLLTTADDLWEALQSGLVLPLSQAYKIPLFVDKEQPINWLNLEDVKIGYKFLHDRVQQASYSLIPEADKQTTHLKIGQLLLEKTNKALLEENIFDIVNQLNIGVDLITCESEKQELANLNLIAGKKAKVATAYEAAVKYLNRGLQLLKQDSWENQYRLTLSLSVETVEAEFLNANFDRAANLAEIALEKAETLLDRIKIHELKMQFEIAQNQMLKAIDTGVEALSLLGISLSTSPNTQPTFPKLPQLEEIENLPVMTAPEDLAAMRILIAIMPAAYQAKPEIMLLVILTMIQLCLDRGHSTLAPYPYALYGMILCAAMGDIEGGYHAGQLGLKLLEQFNAKEFQAKVFTTFNPFIRPWKEHARETLAPFIKGLQSGLEIGDLEYGSYCAMNYCTYLFLVGEHLESVEQKQSKYIDFLLQLKREVAIAYARIWGQLVQNLLGNSLEKYRLIGKYFDESVRLPELKTANNGMLLFAVYLSKLILLYTLKNRAEALENAFLAAEQLSCVMGYMTVATHNFYYSLSLLAMYAEVDASEQEKYLALVESNQEKMKHWADHCPANYQHKYDLIEAEKARVLGQILEAMELYDRAIAGAKEQGYIQEEALANELAAEFYLVLGKTQVAKTYMTEAYYKYIRWGAIAKVKDLDVRYPQLILRSLQPETTNILELTQTNSTTSKSAQILDLTTVLKASLLLSGEIVLSNLLEKLIKVAIENAGARQGCFITKHQEEWIIEASGNIESNEFSGSSTKVNLHNSLLIADSSVLPISILNYVERTGESLILDNAALTSKFTADPYIAANQSKSILCLPLLHSAKLSGILYLENNLLVGTFTAERSRVLNLLSAQISIAIENARLYSSLQTYSQELETKNATLLELSAREREKAEQLAQSLHQLQQTQAQLIQTEKISSLGQLVAGVAHEVNNPVSFINGNLHHANEYVSDLAALLELYQEHYPNPVAEIADKVEEIDLEYLLEDLPKMLSSMKLGTDRIRDIMQSLRNFSRVDEVGAKPANLHEGIDSTLTILNHRLKGKGELKAINIVKKYGDLPLVECYAGQMNQVFMNLLANAIDSMEESRKVSEKQIWISTELVKQEDCSLNPSSFAVIRIKDNGAGMTPNIQQRLFKPFFTTKPAGKGTGLGLSISYQIVTEKHKGRLRCLSAPDEGTEFIVEIPITGN